MAIDIEPNASQDRQRAALRRLTAAHGLKHVAARTGRTTSTIAKFISGETPSKGTTESIRRAFEQLGFDLGLEPWRGGGAVGEQRKARERSRAEPRLVTPNGQEPEHP